jgi:hypothetical protein
MVLCEYVANPICMRDASQNAEGPPTALWF